ncbi:response regulator [Herbiconiux sp. P15]|uniref:response regulator transcription factor n=1 Tax=Herbiconiux liukaitaii TaxID=3342799 RepID=UPI0035B6D618
MRVGASAGIRVVVVDDQPLYRQMLASTLSSAPGITVVGVAAGAGAAREIFAGLRPDAVDVALLDVQLGDGDGIELGLELRATRPGLGIVLLSATDALDVLLELPRPDSQGWSCLSKTSSLGLPALVRAIEVTAEGRTVLDPELVARRKPRRGSGLTRLSARQYEVLRLLAEGLSNAGIASRLGLAPRSVDNHIAAVYAELGLASGGVVNPRVGAALRFLEETAAS